MTEASQVVPGGLTKSPPPTELDNMLSGLELGEPEDKHHLRHECDIILECKICRNLFRVMTSFLNHKKVHCLQYVVSFTLPLPVNNSRKEKADKNDNTTTTEKSELPTAEAVSQKTDETQKLSAVKSEETETESLSDNNQTKRPATTVTVAPSTSVGNTDAMKLRSLRKTDSSISIKEEPETMKKDADTSKRGDILVQKKYSNQSKKEENSGQKLEESLSFQRDDTSKKNVDASTHKKNTSLTPKKNASKKADVATTLKKVDVATTTKKADVATTMKKADVATTPKKADVATTPKKADVATTPKKADVATTPKKADVATTPKKADVATTPKKADVATTPKKADVATTPKKADVATTPKKADVATTPKKADVATTPKKADVATTPKKADVATTPMKADVATTPKKADVATTPKKADVATTPKKADVATTPKKADVATTPKKADVATTAKKADVATTAKKADVATTAKKADAATTAKKADVATTAKKADVASTPKKADVASTPKKADVASTPKKADVASTPKKADVASTPKKADVASTPKKADVASIPKKADVASTPKKADVASKKDASCMTQDEPSRKSLRKDGSPVSFKHDKKGDSSLKKNDSSGNKKDDSSKKESQKKESSIPFRIGAKNKKGDNSDLPKKRDSSDLPKKRDGSDVSKKRDGSDVSKKRDGSDVSKKRDGSDLSKKRDGSDLSKKGDGSDLSKKGDGSDLSKKGDGSDLPKKGDGSIPFKKVNKANSSQKKDSSVPFKKGNKSKKEDSSNQKKEKMSVVSKKLDRSFTPKKVDSIISQETTSRAKKVDSDGKATAPPPFKKQKTDHTNSSSSTIETKVGKLIPASPETTTTVTPSLPAVTVSAPTTLALPVTPTPPVQSTLAPPALIPAPTLALTSTSTACSAVGATTSASLNTTIVSTTPDLTPAAAAATTTTSSTDIKELKTDDHGTELVLIKTESLSAENKADEPPVLTPEKLSPSEGVAVPNRKSDASDTLNPLIAGVLDAYQRYRDKSHDDIPKPTPDESEATTENSMPVPSAEATAPGDLGLPQLSEIAAGESTELKGHQVGDASVELDKKDKSINDVDLDKDLDDPERYELRNRLRCPDCSLELNNMSKLAQHMSTHLANSKGHFVCPICQKETRLETFSELILHLRDPHFLKDKQLLPMWRNLMKNCWVDEKDMSATFPVIEAVKRSERSKDNEVPEKNYKCPYCKKKPKILRYFSGLIGHLRSEHGLKRCQLQRMQAKLRKTSVIEVKHKRFKKKCMLFKCSFCFKTFTKKSGIKLHVKSCRKRTETTVKNKSRKKPRGRPKTFTKIVAFKTVGKKQSISDNSVATSTLAGGEVFKERTESTAEGDQSTQINTALMPSGLPSASNKDADPNYFPSNVIQPIKLETFWVSKTPGKPSECIKSTVTNLEKFCTVPSKMFKSSDLSKIGNFQCYSCNRYYSFRQHFERHVQLCNHNRKIEEISDFESLRCLECNQSFSYVQHLKRHAAKHLGLDRFKCKLCNYSSYYWSDTKYHLTTHKDVHSKHPEYYIINVSASENLMNTEYGPPVPQQRTVPKRVAEASPLVATGSPSCGGGTGAGGVKTLVLTEQDGMLKVVSDPTQIARMVNQQQGSPSLKRLRISADASQAPAILKALPDLQKSVFSPGLKIDKRESTLMIKNLPSPTLSDPTPTNESFEPAVDPDKEHISWVRKPLKDPDAQPFTWDDDEEMDAEGRLENKSSMMPSNNDSVTSTTTSSASNIPSTSIQNEKPKESGPSSRLISQTENKSHVLADQPVPEIFSEPPILEMEMPLVKKNLRGKEKEDLQMPRISASDISTLSDSVMTFMLNENNELFVLAPEDDGGKIDCVSPSKVHQHSHISSKDFLSVPHPSPSYSSTSTSTSSFGSSIVPPPSKLINKPKTYWDHQHKNTLRRLPNRGLVSTSNLSFPSASRRVTRPPIVPQTTHTVTSQQTSSMAASSSTSSSSSSSPFLFSTGEK